MVAWLLESRMEWSRHYDLLMSRARGRILEGYSELHHVVPKCLGGDDSLGNLVRLTPEEHFIAHLLLVRMYPGNRSLVHAAYLMTVPAPRLAGRTRNKMSGWLKRRVAEVRADPEVREVHSKRARNDPRIIEALRKTHIMNAGVPRPDDVREKLSAAHKTSAAAAAARDALFDRKRGVPRSEETKQRLRSAHRGKRLSEEHKAAIAAANKGKPKSSEHIAKVAAALAGKPGTRRGAVTSEETKQKQREAVLRRYYPDGNVPPPRVVDPVRSTAAYRRWAKRRSLLTEQSGKEPSHG